MEGAPDNLQLPLAWIDVNESPILMANQFLVQTQGTGEFVMAIGQVATPPLIGTPEEVREQAEQIEFVPIRTLARVSMTRARIDELIAVLQLQRDRHDEIATPDPRLGGEQT